MEFEFLAGESGDDGGHDEPFAGIEFEFCGFFSGESGECDSEGSAPREGVGLSDYRQVAEEGNGWFASEGDEGEG